MKIKKVGIILKQDSNEPRQIGDEMVAWFADRSISAYLDRIEEDLDILVILGGDGTPLVRMISSPVTVTTANAAGASATGRRAWGPRPGSHISGRLLLSPSVRFGSVS